jgi:hypothetical protein
MANDITTADAFAERFLKDEAFRNHWTTHTESLEAFAGQLKKEGYPFGTDELGKAFEALGARLQGELADETLASVSGGGIEHFVVGVHKLAVFLTGKSPGGLNALLNGGAEVIKKIF